MWRSSGKHSCTAGSLLKTPSRRSLRLPLGLLLGLTASVPLTLTTWLASCWNDAATSAIGRADATTSGEHVASALATIGHWSLMRQLFAQGFPSLGVGVSIGAGFGFGTGAIGGRAAIAIV